MNLLKKQFGLTLQALLWVMIFGCLLAHPFTNATSSPPGDKRDYVLIINSYNESSSWGWEIITDITARIEQIENLEVYVEHMNTLLMDQQSDLDNFRTNLSREYGKNPPRMLIYIGAPAFIMRDFAEKEWGKGIPSIICAEEDFIGPDKYYVSKRAIPHSERIPLRELSGEYNLTLLYAPIYLEQTIELMRRMIPEMNRLVFVRDGRYINQQYEDELRKLLDTDYPGMRFTSYKASNMSVDQLLDSLNVTDTRHTGVLFSSWHYTRNIAGNTEITANPFKIIASSTAPLFALWPSSVKNSGVVGGFTYDVSVYNRQIIKTFNTILEGRQPRDIPFYTPTDAHPTFNYPAMLRNKISPEICPPDSVFIDKPETFAERNRTAIILCGGFFLLFILFQQWRIRVMRKVEAARRRESESQIKYANLFNRMPIIYIQERVIFDEKHYPADTEFSDINAYFERTFLPRNQVVGKRGSELFADSFSEFLRLVNIVLTENRTVTYPFYYKPLDIFFEVILSRSYLTDHIDIFCLDGTALHKAQQKLDSINHKLSLALDVANIVPWKCDLNNRTILCDINKPVKAASGEAILQNEASLSVSDECYFSKIHKEDRDRIRQAYDDLIAGRTDKVCEEYRVISNESGHWHMEWVEALAAVESFDAQGRPKTLVGTSQVITERKRMEQELLSARDRAEESNRLKTAFLANMSHEIRTPLNAIVGFSGILASTEEEQEKQEYVSIIENNNALLLQLIGDILDLSKIEAGTLDFIHTDFDLNELMREKENVIRMKVREGVELLFEQKYEQCSVCTDRNRLSQVIINLLTNAAKFTQTGSIRFGYEMRGRELYFWVSDTGSGIPADKTEQVFERFVKLNTFKQGTGLGLSICKMIVEHLGGRIGVESEEGKGSKFWFILPYVPGKAAAQRTEEQYPVISVEKDKLVILIAEDNDSNYRLFESILRKEYTLLHAWNGLETVEIYRQRRPHLVLMDINMPVMNGYEATAEIRKLSESVPIIAVTAFAFASDEQKVLQSGFDGYMAKPINALQLRTQIVDMLRKHVVLL